MAIWALSDLCTPWCIHVAVTLRIAQHIDAGCHEIAALAAASGAHRDSLHRLLRHLVARGVFAEPQPGCFALNEPARQLLTGGACLGLDLDGFGGRMAGAWSTLLAAVRTGRPAYHHQFGRPFWDDLAAHPAIAALFDALMGPEGHGAPDGDVFDDASHWEQIHWVVDVGGGTGALLAAVLHAHPHLRGTLVDLPQTVARAIPLFQSAGVAERVVLAGQSFFDPLPAGAGLYLLKNVLCDWPDTDAVRILRRCAEAGSRVVVFTNTAPGERANPELLMMVLVGGRDRTIAELERLGGEAGLRLFATRRLPGGKTAVEFRSMLRD